MPGGLAYVREETHTLTHTRNKWGCGHLLVAVQKPRGDASASAAHRRLADVVMQLWYCSSW